MILKTIPRSLRAGVALVALIIFLGTGLSSLRQLLIPGDDSVWIVIKCIGGILIGSLAAGIFYYFQTIDQGVSSYGGLETLSKYHQDEQSRQLQEKVKIKPAYPKEDE